MVTLALDIGLQHAGAQLLAPIVLANLQQRHDLLGQAVPARRVDLATTYHCRL